MIHYTCTGSCGGVSEKPGTCQAENCEMHGRPLTECDCEDSLHKELKEEDMLEDEIEEENER